MNEERESSREFKSSRERGGGEKLTDRANLILQKGEDLEDKHRDHFDLEHAGTAVLSCKATTRCDKS
jgi:hypothetical protein